MSHTFTGCWITAAEFAGLVPVNVFHRQLEKIEIPSAAPKNAHILFRKAFDYRPGGRVFVHISADDYYKLYLNGHFVCQGSAPGYPFHYYYNTVDITEYLVPGGNCLAVHTYYQGLINRVWVSGDDRHGLILDVEQEGEILCATDETFRCARHSGFAELGTVGYKTQYLERYISGSAEEGFMRADYDDSNWAHAVLRRHINYTLVPQPTAMLEFAEIEPTLSVDADGITADFGAMYVGSLCAEAKGAAGDVIELLFGQELNEDGTVRWQLRANCAYREEWVLSGGQDVLDQFDYKAFRYVRINRPAGVELAGIRLRARHYPFALTAKPAQFVRNDPEMTAIWNLCVRSLEWGVQEVIQDCMEREKGNYLGDGCYTALAYTALTGDGAMFRKLIDDSMRSRFVNPGLMTCAACSFMQEIAEYPLMMYYALWEYDRLTGDRDYLAGHYDQLCEILDFYRDSYARPDGMLCDLDKWCVVEWPANYRDGYDVDLKEGKVCREVHNVINAHYIGAVGYMNRIAALLGRPPYADEGALKGAYIDAFYDPARRLFRDSVTSDHVSLIGQAFALMYGLCPDAACEAAIVDLIAERGFTAVMLFGAYPLLAGLRRIGREDLVRRYLADEGAWKRMLREGATATFEGWGKDAKWNTSLFHLTLSYAVLFMME